MYSSTPDYSAPILLCSQIHYPWSVRIESNSLLKFSLKKFPSKLPHVYFIPRKGPRSDCRHKDRERWNYARRSRKNPPICAEDSRELTAKGCSCYKNVRFQSVHISVKLIRNCRLATNLYSRDTRFIYELIQNAEDNEYLQAARNKEEPYVSFTLYPDRLVIDSNEDGFTEANVRAICSTGESTKTNVSGYIGEKGIGFKSVFKVAKKVNIQSGPFSFYFEHTRGVDDGLGMVIPLDAEFYELPPGVRTRLTLTLIKATDFNSRCDDLSNIPDTFLLFFSKLKQLTVKINPAQGPTKTIVHKLVESQRTCIRKTITVGQNSRVEEQFFHVFTKPVSNLPDDESRPSNKEATIVLAFPVDQSDKPILEEQYTYAFLPLRKTGFTVRRISIYFDLCYLLSQWLDASMIFDLTTKHKTCSIC